MSFFGIGANNAKLLLIGPKDNGTNLIIQKLTQKYSNIDELQNIEFGINIPDTFILNQFYYIKQQMLEICPIDAFVLVIQFDSKQPIHFLEKAKQFFKCFGSIGIESLIILCIQKNNQKAFSEDEFDQIIQNSDGFKYLRSKNNNNIQYCLLDIINPKFDSKEKKKFEKCLSLVQKYTSDHMKTALERAKDLIDQEEENNGKYSERHPDNVLDICDNKNKNINNEYGHNVCRPKNQLLELDDDATENGASKNSKPQPNSMDVANAREKKVKMGNNDGVSKPNHQGLPNQGSNNVNYFPSWKINEHEFNKTLKNVLVTGSADEETIELFFQKQISSNLKRINKHLYECQGRANYWVNCELHRYRFNLEDFANMCHYIQSLNSNDFEIYCIENMNPRPETLIYDVQALRKIYMADQLKKFLTIVFTFSAGAVREEIRSNEKETQEMREEKIKKGVLKYDVFFENLLEIYDEREKENFYHHRIILYHN